MGSIGVSGKASESSLTSGMVAWSWFGKGNREPKIQTPAFNRVLQLSTFLTRALSDPELRLRIHSPHLKLLAQNAEGSCLLPGGNFNSNLKVHYLIVQAGLELLDLIVQA